MGCDQEKSLSNGVGEDYGQLRRAQSTAIWGVPIAMFNQRTRPASGLKALLGETVMQRSRRNVIIATAVTGAMALLRTRVACAASEAAEISGDAARALHRLYAQDKRAANLGQKAAGILVFPKIVKVGFIFGGQGGKGVLTVHGRTRGYYSIAAASFGLQAGAQWFSYALFFIDEQALQYLDKSDGWAIGTDPNVVVVDKGGGKTFDSTTLSHRVIALPFGEKGLMASLSLSGSKITTYKPE